SIFRFLHPTPCSLLPALLGSGLSDLLLQLLARVADALVLVRIRLAEGAHISGNLAYLLPVYSGDRDVGLLWIDRNLDAARKGELDGMRVSQCEHHHTLALHLYAVTDADDV